MSQVNLHTKEKEESEKIYGVLSQILPVHKVCVRFEVSDG